MGPEVRVTRAGWFNFEGFGGPWEGWARDASEADRLREMGRGELSWSTAGRALTRAAARRKAERKLEALKASNAEQQWMRENITRIAPEGPPAPSGGRPGVWSGPHGWQKPVAPPRDEDRPAGLPSRVAGPDLGRTLAEYNAKGWVIVALPPELAAIVVGQPATQVRAVELSNRIEAMRRGD